MAGQSMGTMNVYMNDQTSLSALKLWSRTGDQSGEWLMFERTIKSINKFTVGFMRGAVRGQLTWGQLVLW